MTCDIRLFRPRSDLFSPPPVLGGQESWHEAVDPKVLKACQKKIQAYIAFGGRLTLHPPPRIRLGSSSKTVRKRSVVELEGYALNLDILGLPQNHLAPINIHLSTGRSGLENLPFFFWSMDRLSVRVRSRLVLENEDKYFWNCKNIVKYFPDFPVTLDWHHHRINNSGESPEEVVTAVSETWGSTVPLFHLATGARFPMDRRHGEWVSEIPSQFINGNRLVADVEIEAEKKDLAVLFLKAAYRL